MSRREKIEKGEDEVVVVEGDAASQGSRSERCAGALAEEGRRA